MLVDSDNSVYQNCTMQHKRNKTFSSRKLMKVKLHRHFYVLSVKTDVENRNLMIADILL